MEKILDLQNQSSLAKLLATENITVTHDKSLSTAYFDVKNRVLGLPVWKDQGKVVYDMLVGHEVSHALYTPHEEFDNFLKSEGRAHFDILNIVEDIRIERLIKLKYAGMPRIFNGAYKKLVESDLFKIEDKNIDELNFIDRLNLHAKIGPHREIPLSDEELEIYNKCMKAETFKDVVALYYEIKDLISKDQEKEQNQKDDSSDKGADAEEDESSSENSEDSNENGEESFENVDGDEVADDGEESFSNSSPEDSEDSEDSDADVSESIESGSETSEDSSASESEAEAGGNKGDISKDYEKEFKSETLNSFSENILDEASNSNKTQIALMPTKSTIEKVIFPYKEVMANRPNIEFYIRSQRGDGYSITLNTKYNEMKKTINKKVSILAREFERRKAAYQYSRAQESRRGSIDVNRLHKYKYDDQIFQTTMRLADAKSHGMIFFIDYSGSMSYVLKDVLEHTLNLIHFCKKVGIPFQVYSFTSNGHASRLNQSKFEFDMDSTIIAELFSSDMSKNEYEQAFKSVAYQILTNDRGLGSKYEQLGGTPLDATLIAAHHIVNKFNKKHAVQKTNVIILSDGDSHRCKPRNFTFGTTSYLTNIGGKQVKFFANNMTAELTKVLSETTRANLIGFFLPNDSKGAKRHLNKMCGYVNHESSWKKYKKDGYLVKQNTFGYNSYFLLNSNIKIEDEEFEFDKVKSIAESRVAQSQLAREYSKHNAAARQSRIILTKFAELIA